MGIYLSKVSDKFKISNNKILGGGFGVYAVESKAVVYNNEIKQSDWFGINSVRSSLTITDNKIFAWGWGIKDVHNSSSIIANNIICGHNGGGGVQSYGNSTTVIKDNTIVWQWVGVQVWNSSAVVTDNIFIRNGTAIKWADNMWGDMGLGPSKFFVTDNIFYFNEFLVWNGVNNKQIYSDDLVIIGVDSAANSFANPGDLWDGNLGYTSHLVSQGYSPGKVSTDYGKMTLGSNTMNQKLANFGMNQNFLNIINRPIGMIDLNDAQDSLSFSSPAFLKNGDNTSSILDRLVKTDGSLGDVFNVAWAKNQAGNVAKAYALSIPISNADGQRVGEAEVALKLVSIVKNPTDEQKAILDAVESVIREADAESDKEVKRASEEFVKAVSLVLVAQAIPGLFEEGDFATLTKAMTLAATSQKELYDRYLKDTEGIYDQLAKLMGVSMDQDNLPQDFAYFANMSDKAKKKLLVDMALEKLSSKDIKTLSNEERTALDIAHNTLAPMREAYLNQLKGILNSFVSTVNNVLKAKESASVKEEDTGMKAMFLLNKARK
jgi:hypothetical protein